jgi:hypothetical membrane protein
MERSKLKMEKFFALLGVAGPLIAYLSIALSICLTPNFSWFRNALSDLGHAQKSVVAPVFNAGLLVSGFLVAIYSIKSLAKHAKYTSTVVALSALMLQAVATFDEIYGFIHFVVSVLFFIFTLIACLFYSVEKKSTFALIAFLAGLLAWVLYWLGVYRAGVAVPEIISALAVTSVIIYSAVGIFKSSNISPA